MAAEDSILVAHVCLLTGTCLVYALYNLLPRYLSLYIAWYALGPVALLYGEMLVYFSRHEPVALPENSRGSVSAEHSSEDAYTLSFFGKLQHPSYEKARNFLSRQTSLLTAKEEPPATVKSCSVATLCTLTTEFIALSHVYQAYDYFCGLTDPLTPFDWGLLSQIVAAVVAWSCYMVTVCVLELEILDLYHQKNCADTISRDFASN